MKENQRLTKVIDNLLEKITKWRKIHHTRSPVPPELWNRAPALAREHGLWKTAHALRLAYTAPKSL